MTLPAWAQKDSIFVKKNPWKYGGTLGLSLTGNGLASWASGGRSSISGIVYGRLNLRYEDRNMLWESHLNLEYGAQWKDQEWDKFQETNDKIDFNTKFGYNMGQKVYLSAYTSFLSQFAFTHNYTNNEKPDYVTGKFLAPAYFDIGVGIDYTPFSWLSVYFSPVTCRTTIVVVEGWVNRWYERRMRAYVNDPERNKEGYTLADFERYLDPGTGETWGLEKELKDKYTVWNYGKNGTVRDYSKNVKADVGMMIRANASYTWKNLTGSTMLELYTPYKIDKRPVYYKLIDDHKVYYVTPTADVIEKENLQWEGYHDNNRRFFNWDVRWEVSLSYHFLKVLDVQFFSDLRYVNGLKIGDTNNGETKENFEFGHEKVQWKGTWGIGVGYAF